MGIVSTNTKILILLIYVLKRKHQFVKYPNLGSKWPFNVESNLCSLFLDIKNSFTEVICYDMFLRCNSIRTWHSNNWIQSRVKIERSVKNYEKKCTFSIWCLIRGFSLNIKDLVCLVVFIPFFIWHFKEINFAHFSRRRNLAQPEVVI